VRFSERFIRYKQRVPKATALTTGFRTVVIITINLIFGNMIIRQ